MADALRIGLFTHSVNPRGGVVHTLELARALHFLGHRVTVFAPAAPGERLFREAPHEVDLVPVPPAPKRLADRVGEHIVALREHLARRLQHETFDILHAHDGIGGNALADLAEAGRIAGFVRTVHHLDPFDDARLAAWQRRSVQQAARVLCVSPGWCMTIKREFGLDAALVANGVDCAHFGRMPSARDTALAGHFGLRRGAPLFLSVGGIEARKNSLRLLEAYIRLREELPQAQLVVAGGASLLDHSDTWRAFHALAEEVGLKTGTDLVLTGPLLDEDMPPLLRLADALVMPSLREGFGLVVLEALACGTPVVVSGIPPFTEYLEDTVIDGHALYADPQEPASIALAMRRAVEPSRRRALAAEVPPVCRRYSWPASAARHVELYRALLN
ncbi:MAG: MSMEG_0565 family glycosyltransferase [Piscinibacter sp.]|uniref:MSMEG_0565 family glycosyltransferase n=1 Tax=Piscinibacter sp. TaxID=1903157 RepID=UPI00258A4BDB|nr:MSMEG_0565 family glycosyltransferase [Piscinibacter sp.]MCW5664785.1 MSMEG_0565 family glycosyltransferase [Piscinibacter sp.]